MRRFAVRLVLELSPVLRTRLRRSSKRNQNFPVGLLATLRAS